MAASGSTMLPGRRGFGTSDRDVQDLPTAKELPMAKGNNAQRKNVKKPKKDKAAKKK